MTEAAVSQPTRINEEAYDLKTGRPVEAARGLQDRMQARAVSTSWRMGAVPGSKFVSTTEGWGKDRRLSCFKRTCSERVPRVYVCARPHKLRILYLPTNWRFHGAPL
jgi:hypothetical protein